MPVSILIIFLRLLLLSKWWWWSSCLSSSAWRLCLNISGLLWSVSFCFLLFTGNEKSNLIEWSEELSPSAWRWMEKVRLPFAERFSFDLNGLNKKAKNRRAGRLMRKIFWGVIAVIFIPQFCLRDAPGTR